MRQGFSWGVAAVAICLLTLATTGRVQATPAETASMLAPPPIAAAHFEEPLVATVATSEAEDADLAAAIARYNAATVIDDVSALEVFLRSHPHSGWHLAALTNLGLAYEPHGYFSKALEAFDQAWREGEKLTGPRVKALTDRAAGELLRLHAKLGHADAVASLLEQMAGRPMSGRASEWRNGAKERLWQMRQDPGHAFLCGPSALKNLLLAGGAKPEQVAFLDAYTAGPHGVSLAEIGHLADQAKLPYRLVHRTTDQPVPVPSVVHWKLDHFAAITGEHDGLYDLVDPTPGRPRRP